MPLYLPPLHVHLLCLGASGTPARAAHDAIDSLFQGDPLLHAVSTVDLPTFAIPFGPHGLAPIRWGDAQRHAIVIFHDDAMHADDRWGDWLEALVDEASRHEAKIFTVTDSPSRVGNLSPKLASKQLIRVPRSTTGRVDSTDETLAEAWASEVCLRLLRGVASMLARANEGLGKLFLSHAKSDGVWLAEALRELLSAHGDEMNFFDAVSLRPGEDFDEGLKAGFDGAVVVALQTDHYSSRYWCVWEVIYGKNRGCPFLAVDLLTEGEVRSLRYVGNARSMRWPLEVPATAEARATWARDSKKGAKHRAMRSVIHGALVELVRWRHDWARIAAAQQAGALPGHAYALGGPAELATLPEFVAGETPHVVHADPPLPRPERALIKRIRPDVCVESLTEALAGSVSLARVPRMRVALSISDPPDLADQGLTKGHLYRMWSRLTLQLLLAGTELGYGGDLRQGGYTERLRDLLMSLAGLQFGPTDRVVHCYLGWPTHLGITADQWAEYPRAIVRHCLAKPTGDLLGFDPAAAPDWSSLAVQLGWTASMRAMRLRMARDCSARIIVGGQYRAVSPIPGIVDELTTFLDLGKPVYLLGGFGGMTAVLTRALLGEHPEQLTVAFQDDGGKRTSLREGITNHIKTAALREGGDGPLATPGEAIDFGEGDLSAIVTRLHELGPGGLENGLDAEENRRLFRTRDPIEAVSLVLRGLAAR